LKGNTIKIFGVHSPISGLLLLFLLAHFGHHLLTALPIPLLPMIRSEFVLDYNQSGLLISAFTLSYGISQLPSGWLANLVGSHRLITIGISGVAVAGLLVGLSQDFSITIIFLVLMGVVAGGYHPAASLLISDSVAPKNRGQALGFHVIGGSASHFLSPLIGIGIATAWGWHNSFIVLSVPTAIFGIIFYIILCHRVNEGEKKHRIEKGHYEMPFTSGRLRRLVVFMILSTVNRAVVFCKIAFIPLFVVDKFGVSKGTAAACIAIIHSTGFWAGFVGGFISDRFGRIIVILAVCLVYGPVICLMSLVPWGLGFVVLLLIIGMAMKTQEPVSEAYIIRQTPQHHRSKILGIYFFSSMESGGLLTPVMGYLIDRVGFNTIFIVAGLALLAITLICSIWLFGSQD
jgi:MFS family permease